MLRRRPLGNDDGAVAVIVALFLAFVLLPAMLFVVDTGGVYAERRQLQHGADAGVMAVAQSCAAGACDAAKATPMATGNNKSGAAVLQVCGTLLGITCATSPAAPDASPYDCEPLPPATSKFVRVQVRSAGPGWQPLFAAGRINVEACATASLRPLGGLTGGLPITMSICEWDQATTAPGGTRRYAPPPPYDPFPAPVSPDPAIYEKIIELQAGGTSTDSADVPCPRGPGNSLVPGGFGWLAGPGCTAVFTDPVTAPGGSGSSEEVECKTRLKALHTSREPVFVPVANTFTGTGGGTYGIVGYAAFVLTGYDLASAGKEKSWLTDQFPTCPGSGGSGKCITGFFTQALAPVGSVASSGESFGATTPALTS